MSDNVQDLVAQLEQLGYRVVPPAPKMKPHRCSVCGAYDENELYQGHVYDLSDVSDDADAMDWLTKIRVEVGEQGEEGWDFKELLLCPRHDRSIIFELIKLGFGTHHHGSTHPLADSCCPGEVSIEHCPVAKGEFISPYDELQ